MGAGPGSSRGYYIQQSIRWWRLLRQHLLAEAAWNLKVSVNIRPNGEKGGDVDGIVSSEAPNRDALYDLIKTSIDRPQVEK